MKNRTELLLSFLYCRAVGSVVTCTLHWFFTPKFTFSSWTFPPECKCCHSFLLFVLTINSPYEKEQSVMHITSNNCN